jgi:hypothetical protein
MAVRLSSYILWKATFYGIIATSNYLTCPGLEQNMFEKIQSEY